MVKSNPMMEAALRYAAMGWRVFPVRKMGKAPALNGWQAAATTNPEQVKRWWGGEFRDCNVGIATGAESGVVVMDVDGEEGLLALEEKGVDLSGPRVKTRKGWHVYLRHPGGELRNKVRFGLLLDSRADGGLVVVPPSVHETGHVYEWETEPVDTGSLPPVPFMLEMVLRQRGNVGEDGQKQRGVTGGVPKGARNDTIFREASYLRGRGYEREAIYATISKLNEEQCQPPLTDGEVQVIVDQAMRYAPGRAQAAANKLDRKLTVLLGGEGAAYYADEAEWGRQELDAHQLQAFLSFPLSDVGMAQRFQMLHGSQFRYDADNDYWLAWSGQHWEPCTEGKVYRAVANIAAVARGLYLSGRVEDEEQQKALQYAIEECERARGIETIVKVAGTLAGLETRVMDYDSDPLLIATRGGTFDLSLDYQRPALQEDLISRCAGAAYDPDAECPEWEAFLLQVMSGDRDRVDFLQRALGYSLTGDMREQVFFMMVGDGANGKSTMMRAVEAAMGTYATTAGFETFEASGHQDREAKEVLARKKGSRLISASEAEDERVLAEARVKRITGGDPIAVRGMYKDGFEYRPTFKVWLTLNQMPIVLNPDFSFRRRLIVVDFKERFNGATADKQIERRLLAEVPGILRWIIDGAREWYLNGLQVPESVRLATDEQVITADLVYQWLEESCEQGPEHVMGATEAWSAFNEWCKAGNHRLRSSTWFGRRMTKAGVARGVDSKGNRCYRGLRLKAQQFSFTG